MNPVRLVLAANRNYRVQVAAVLASIRVNASPATVFEVTLLTRDLTLRQVPWRNRGPNDTLRCYMPPIGDQDVLPRKANDHVSIETYYRLYLDTAFESRVERVIYLDCDIIALSDLQQLACSDLGGKCVGAVREYLVNSCGEVSAALRKDSEVAASRYFNAGVLVIDLAAWRRQRVRDRALEFLRWNSNDVRWWDQDALNAVLAGQWQELDPRWNRMSTYWDLRGRSGLPFAPPISDALEKPFLVHFANPEKPWNWYEHPDKPIYDRYLAVAGLEHCRLTRRGALLIKWKRRCQRRLRMLFDNMKSL